MNTRLLLASLTLVCAALFSGCETTASKQGRELASQDANIFNVEVPQGTDVEVVQRVIVQALFARNWVVTEQTDGQISATLDHRNIHGSITINYSATSITIKDNSVDANGNPFVPVRWIKYLMADIHKNIAVFVTNQAQ